MLFSTSRGARSRLNWLVTRTMKPSAPTDSPVPKFVTIELTTGQAKVLSRLYHDVLHHGVHSTDLNLEHSKLIRAINARQFQIAVAELMKWCYRRGEVDWDMRQRRQEEVHLFRESH